MEETEDDEQDGPGWVGSRPFTLCDFESLWFFLSPDLNHKGRGAPEIGRIKRSGLRFRFQDGMIRG
jgi:hypothetical protein